MKTYRQLREPKTLDDIVLDETGIRAALEASPIPFRPYEIDVDDYRAWMQRADYDGRHPDYYRQNLAEKSLEHYIAVRLLDLQPGQRYIDIACQSPTASEIYERLYGIEAYQQDLDFPAGLHGRQIGGDAAALPIPDAFADAMALHCSFEHFEGPSDTGFIREAGRVLKPGGRCAILPLYLCQDYCCLTDPSISVPAGVAFEPDMRIHAFRWYQNRHGRFYDVPHLVERVWNARGTLEMEILAIENFRATDPGCYVRYALVLTKPDNC